MINEEKKQSLMPLPSSRLPAKTPRLNEQKQSALKKAMASHPYSRKEILTAVATLKEGAAIRSDCVLGARAMLNYLNTGVIRKYTAREKAYNVLEQAESNIVERTDPIHGKTYYSHMDGALIESRSSLSYNVNSFLQPISGSYTVNLFDGAYETTYDFDVVEVDNLTSFLVNHARKNGGVGIYLISFSLCTAKRGQKPDTGHVICAYVVTKKFNEQHSGKLEEHELVNYIEMQNIGSTHPIIAASIKDLDYAFIKPGENLIDGRYDTRVSVICAGSAKIDEATSKILQERLAPTPKIKLEEVDPVEEVAPLPPVVIVPDMVASPPPVLKPVQSGKKPTPRKRNVPETNTPEIKEAFKVAKTDHKPIPNQGRNFLRIDNPEIKEALKKAKEALKDFVSSKYPKGEQPKPKDYVDASGLPTFLQGQFLEEAKREKSVMTFSAWYQREKRKREPYIDPKTDAVITLPPDELKKAIAKRKAVTYVCWSRKISRNLSNRSANKEAKTDDKPILNQGRNFLRIDNPEIKEALKKAKEALKDFVNSKYLKGEKPKPGDYVDASGLPTLLQGQFLEEAKREKSVMTFSAWYQKEKREREPYIDPKTDAVVTLPPDELKTAIKEGKAITYACWSKRMHRNLSNRSAKLKKRKFAQTAKAVKVAKTDHVQQERPAMVIASDLIEDRAPVFKSAQDDSKSQINTSEIKEAFKVTKTDDKLIPNQGRNLLQIDNPEIKEALKKAKEALKDFVNSKYPKGEKPKPGDYVDASGLPTLLQGQFLEKAKRKKSVMTFSAWYQKERRKREPYIDPKTDAVVTLPPDELKRAIAGGKAITYTCWSKRMHRNRNNQPEKPKKRKFAQTAKVVQTGLDACAMAAGDVQQERSKTPPVSEVSRYSFFAPLQSLPQSLTPPALKK